MAPVRLLLLVAVAVFSGGCAKHEAGHVAGSPTVSPMSVHVPAPTPSWPAAPRTAMPENEFWNVIESVRGADVASSAEALGQLLRSWPATKLEAYQQRFVSESHKLYTHDDLDAAHMLCLFAGDDTFTDYRSWVIAHGRAAFEAVVADPDNLADFGDLDDACEASGEFFGEAANEPYFAAAHTDAEHSDLVRFPFLEAQDWELLGARHSRWTRAERFPDLAARLAR